ncbi:hypothetical protein RUMTOR_02314 [[Ruminococcus] torques ATCC 27756]|uniref:Uncharacterized protein n=1 Tax=[Ruminococcus] torques ATCC 27756 TaxID=411460 RepID=A5KPX8_9FIRM|nr:hypothetical protein RUMTOR_02314 [[Ruminococcus] torques ATCC 27756]
MMDNRKKNFCLYDRVLLFFYLEDVILWRNDRREKYE